MANPVVREILRQGRRRPRKHVKAALETGIVESGLRNLSYGDSSSVGWRQELNTYGSVGERMNLRHSVRRFFREAAQHDAPGKPARELAADVQRPAAQYRGRYGQVRGQAEAILQGRSTGGSGGGGSVTPGTPARLNLSRKSMFDAAGYQQAQRRSIIAQMLQRSGHGGTLFRTGLLSTAAPNPADFQSSRLVSSITPGTDPQVSFDGAPATGHTNRAVKAARNHLGISEVGTSNRSTQVDKMERRFGLIGQPWCGIFVGTVLRKAGVHVDSRIASVPAIEAMARSHEGSFRGFHGGTRHARQGDLVITKKGQHVAFIEKVDSNGTIHTIGGNQSGAVTRVAYRPGTVYGTVRVRYGG